MPRIVVTGAESTGKTELAKFLASAFKGIYIPEYARNYVTRLNRKYTYEDVVRIAEKQVEQVNQHDTTGKLVFVDTFLIIIKIWFEVVFGKYPGWIHEYLLADTTAMYLVCFPDIPWVADDVRENGGEKRLYLHYKYIEQLEYYNLPFQIISGDFQQRNNMASKIINSNILSI